MEYGLDISVNWCSVKDQTFLARDTLGLKPLLSFIETLCEGVILKILDPFDEVSVKTLTASPL